jgi:hypothetical protein
MAAPTTAPRDEAYSKATWHSPHEVDQALTEADVLQLRMQADIPGKEVQDALSSLLQASSLIVGACSTKYTRVCR